MRPSGCCWGFDMNDDFQWWRDALAGKPGPISDSPMCGFFKLRSGKNQPFQPVAIWRKDGVLVCRVSDNMRDPMEVWIWAAKNPVSKEDAKLAFETGAFPGDIPLSGHNSGALSLPDEIADVSQSALDWLRKTSITDKASADMCANFRAKLLALGSQADKQREGEKRPHLDASRAVDAKYKPSIDQAADAASQLRDALTIWMRAEDTRLRKEAEAKHAEAEAIARKARAAAEAERQAAIAALPPAARKELAPPLVEPELPMFTPEPVKVQAGGQRGRKAGLREITRYVVIDHAAALAFFATSDAVKELVQKLSEQASKAGAAVPGVSKTVEKVAA